MRNSKFITVGLGPVGRTLTHALKDAGYKPVCLVGRNRTSDMTFAREIGVKLLKEFPKVVDNIDFVLMTLPTSRLVGYSAELAKRALPWSRLVFVHASGSFGVKPLDAIKACGAGVVGMHPYQTFPKKQSAVKLNGITFGITGNRKGTALAKRIVRDIGGQALLLREEDRMLYHLSAILACTFVAANIQMAAQVLMTLGVKELRALRVALPIAEETIRNIKELGIRAAMTGPQTRGDAALIRRHLKELRTRLPELQGVYRSVSEWMMQDSGKQGRKQNSK